MTTDGVGRDAAARARALLARGDSDAALAIAEAWVTEAPREAEAHNLLGLVLIARRAVAAAEVAFREATRLAPSLAKAFSNLGGVLRERGDLQGAVEALRRAVALDPRSHRGWLNLGNALRQQGRHQVAKDAYLRSLMLESSASAHLNLGSLLVEGQYLVEATEQFEAGLRLEPDGPRSALLRASLAEALAMLGRRDEAGALLATMVQRETSTAVQVRLVRAVLALSGPSRASEALAEVHADAEVEGEVWELRSRIAERLGDLTTAEAAASRAAATIHSAQAWCQVARLRQRMRDAKGVDEALHRAEEADPRSALPWLGRAEVALRDDDIAAAERACREALEREPGLVDADIHLTHIAALRGDAPQAARICRSVLERKPGDARTRMALLLLLHYAHHPPEELLEDHLLWSRLHGRTTSARFDVGLPIGRKLRVGYVSSDLRVHVVACFVEGLFGAHDRSSFEIFVYDSAERRDVFTARLRTLVDVWREVHDPDDAALARTIADDHIDVLVDLGGFTSQSRLPVMAWRPAPVQVSFLGYPDTTGMPAVDVRLTDAHADPPGQADRYVTEELVRLPRCAWEYKPLAHAPAVATRPASAPIVFGVLGNVMKVSELARKTYAEILRSVPGSRLLCKGRSYDDPTTRERFLAPFVEAGVADRVELRKWTLAHLETYNEIDIALDTFPYVGTTTTCEALWMGVPVVTLAGDRHAGRVGVSLLHAVGLDNLVAEGTTEYVDIAVRLATNSGRRAKLRAKLRDRMATSPLCDGASYARAIEHVYRTRHEAYVRFAQETTEPDVWLGLSDGSVVSVPDRSDVATRFILEEQGDWFERELGFVRALLDDGDVAADVGANFGVYSLAFAKRVGPKGRVLSFEPAPVTAAHLRRSAARAAAIRVVQAAVGASRGRSRFDLGPMPELAQLIEDSGPRDGGIEVDVVPLDDFLDELSGILLAKVDAEGAEHLVLAGAQKLLTREDPIWLLELRHGSALNHALLAALDDKAPHLELMRWVDPLGALVPFDPGAPLDGKWLNVVALSPARRHELTERRLATRNEACSVDGRSEDPETDARSAYGRALDVEDPTERFDDVMRALGFARRAFREERSVRRAFLLARIAHVAGFDGEANAAMADITARIEAGERVTLDDDAFTPLPSQEASREALDPATAVEALALQARLQLGAWSSYYAMVQHETWLERLTTLDALTPRLVRMRDTIRRFRARSRVKS